MSVFYWPSLNARVRSQAGGANLNAQEKDGLTPLQIIADKGHDACVEWLIKEGGVNPNIQVRALRLLCVVLL